MTVELKTWLEKQLDVTIDFLKTVVALKNGEKSETFSAKESTSDDDVVINKQIAVDGDTISIEAMQAKYDG